MTARADWIEHAREAVLHASVVCRAVQSRIGEVRAITKDDNSPVTVADFAAQAVVAHVLAQRLGTFVLVGEESSDFLKEAANDAQLSAAVDAARVVWPDVTRDKFIAALERGHGEPNTQGFWTLDPVDGTKGFLRGEQYAVALAYVEHGEPVIGAMGCPNLPASFDRPLSRPDPTGTVYSCIRGGGLFESDAVLSATPRKITRESRTPGAPLRVTASVEKAHSNISATDQVAALVSPSFDLVQVDSQCKYAVVARGQGDLYLRLPTKKGYVERIWDHAAGSLVASEGGCVVTDVYGKPLEFGHGRGLEMNAGIVCCERAIHGAVIDAIAKVQAQAAG
ncbi:MAG: 3'(2'),5'-bisphosphate nucleotidase [Phycisphaerae bacterium]|nr:3'(2'),5'-bisphosphate nucleotidase [Phycisphaerae bacterium]